ncbi:MAG: DNA-binding response regulator [Desulfobulbus propionicus]|nr:MAG: DNA-binding response regulator [Desulfobulbus propionicus]
MGEAKAHILVVEDDPAIRNGLSDVLVFNGYEVTAEEDGQKGLERLLQEYFDLALLDVMLPTKDGFTLCREARAAKPNQPIIMLTAKGAEDDIVTGFKAGADDYITKPFSLRELMMRVEAILRRSGKSVGEEQVVVNEVLFDGHNLAAEYAGKTTPITRKEMDIILYLHRFQERIVSKKELLSEVWQYTDPGVETRTVDIHMLKLRKKIQALGVDGDFIKTVRGEGYRLEHEAA